jgi:hypothetical protein
MEIMNKQQIRRMGWVWSVAASLVGIGLGAPALAQDQDQTRTQLRDQTRDMTQDREQDADGAPIFGSQLMTQRERNVYRARMRNLNTPEEREALRLEHHKQMQERARAQGITLPDTPPAGGMRAGPGPAAGAGTGGGGGMGGGMGGGAGPGGKK